MSRKPIIENNSPEREAEIQRQIAAEAELSQTPPNSKVLKRGRPAGQTKEQVTVRLDKTLLKALQTPDPKGWQTRLNEAVQRGLAMK